MLDNLYRVVLVGNPIIKTEIRSEYYFRGKTK